VQAELERWLTRRWWRRPPGGFDALAPLSLVYRALVWAVRRLAGPPAELPVPVVVVGNLVVGGAGKTPVVIALAAALRERGWRPGVVSRGHGGAARAPREVGDDARADDVGDEPVLLRRRCGVPVWVGRRRAEVVLALCRRHPEVDVVVSDDGLQHAALARDAEYWLFDERGIGNGRALPAGPLRVPLPDRVPDAAQLLYTAGVASTPLPGTLLQRHPRGAWPLDDWWRGDAASLRPLAALGGRPLHAVAGIGAPERFFAMLRDHGLDLTLCPQPDHARYPAAPWPADATDVVTTEKDAVKLVWLAARGALGGARVWVVPLDSTWPAELTDRLEDRLRRRRPHDPHRPPRAAP
jgi:tetraacyldisaccharide 4'-kinase